MKQPPIKPTIVIPDAAPLIHLAAGDALFVLNGMGRVVVPDIVQLETRYCRDKPPHIKVMSDKVNPIIRRYADGEISAMQAASELGGRATVADVILMLRQAEQMRAELAHARRVLGMDRG